MNVALRFIANLPAFLGRPTNQTQRYDTLYIIQASLLWQTLSFHLSNLTHGIPAISLLSFWVHCLCVAPYEPDEYIDPTLLYQSAYRFLLIHHTHKSIASIVVCTVSKCKQMMVHTNTHTHWLWPKRIPDSGLHALNVRAMSRISRKYVCG